MRKTAEEWVDVLLTVMYDKQAETFQAIFAAGAEAQREADADALWRVLVSGKGNSFDTVRGNALVALPKGET